MDTGRATLIICITLFVVIGINAAIYVSVMRRRTGGVGQIELLRRAAYRARSPWQQEDGDLQELARRVAALKERGSQKPGGEDETS